MILALPARAKLNLSLAITGVRSDRYHEVDTVLQAIDLHDLLEAEPAADTSLEVVDGEAPAGADNLVLKALAELERAAGRLLPTRFRLHKRIPAGAGLGGGSSDAATALRLAAALHGVDIGAAAVAVGADVPFFLCGGAARATGRGEVLEPRASSAAWFALVWPGFELSTSEVYARWDEVGGEGANQLTRAAQVVDPRLAEFGEQLGQGWQMTGSGSAFFALCATATEAEERRRQAPHGVWTATARAIPRWC